MCRLKGPLPTSFRLQRATSFKQRLPERGLLPSPARSPPPLLQSRISGKRNRNYKTRFFYGWGKSQLQTRCATTLRHDKGREEWGDQKIFLKIKRLKKNLENLFKTTHFTLTPTFHHRFQFLCATSLTMSIFSPSPHHPLYPDRHDCLPRSPVPLNT